MCVCVYIYICPSFGQVCLTRSRVSPQEQRGEKWLEQDQHHPRPTGHFALSLHSPGVSVLNVRGEESPHFWDSPRWTRAQTSLDFTKMSHMEGVREWQVWVPASWFHSSTLLPQTEAPCGGGPGSSHRHAHFLQTRSLHTTALSFGCDYLLPPPKNHQHRYSATPLTVIKWASQLTNPLRVQWGLNWVWRHRCLTRWREGASQPLISNTCFIHRNRDPAETPREFSLACALDWDQSGSESASLPDRVISDMSSYNTGHPGEGPREELVGLFWGKTTALQSGWSPGWENTEPEEARRGPWMLCQTRPPGAMTRF